MSEVSRSTQEEPIFGVFSVLLLGSLILFCALLALPLHQIHIFNQSLAERICLVLPFRHYPWMGVMLWVLEIGAYFGIAWHYARQPRVALAGVLIGVLTRVIISVLMSLLMLGPYGESFLRVVLANEGKLWIYHVLAVLFTLLAFMTAFRNLWQTHFGTKVLASPSHAGSEAKAFAFSTIRSTVLPGSEAAGASSQQAFASAHSLAPPAGFIRPVPVNDVVGIVSIPVQVVLESVPEARTVLDAQRPVRIQLGLFLPQLASATVWLTWQQIFTGKDDDLNRLDVGYEAIALLRDRWIRIPAHNYIHQIPRDYFRKSKRSASWMRLAQVEQEALFGEESAEGIAPAAATPQEKTQLHRATMGIDGATNRGTE